MYSEFCCIPLDQIGGGGDVEDSMVFVSRLQERENIENITIAILVHKRETT
jgi:hypothetical protein